MAKPYRWGDLPPPASQRIKARREYRESSFFVGLKARRGEAFDLESGATSSEALPALPSFDRVVPLRPLA